MTAQQSAERIYNILNDALSQQTHLRQRAEKALRDAEERHDYFASLAAIATASDDQAEPEVRWLAAVCGKNAVFRSWRRRAAASLVTNDERQYVRACLLGALGEAHSTISTQISVWISYIARIDFPDAWPNLLSDLVQAFKKPDAVVMSHALVTMDMVLKQLASRRLISHRRALYRVAPMLFSELYQQFCHSLQVLLQNAAPPEQLQKHFDVLVRCMKSFRRLISYGCEKLSDLPNVPPLMSKIVDLPQIFMCAATPGNDFQIRLTHLASKLIRVTHERHPLQFQPYLPTFLKLYYQTLISYNAGTSHDRTCFQAVSFLKNAVQCPSYLINSTTISKFKAAPNLNPDPQAPVSAETCRAIVLLFFDDNRTDLLIETMITKVFVLTQREADTWAADPEALILDEEAAEWGAQSLRHECEELFKLLLIRDKPRIVPKILQIAETVSRDKPLMLDACYRAVGKAVYDVQGAFDFEVWLNGHLGAILQSDCSDNLGDRIIQARTAWLVAQFAEQLTRDSRRVVNPLLVRLLTFMDRDLVIALTAAKAIQTLVEDLGFHAGDFAVHLQTCVENCFLLINKCDAFETKRDILGTVTCLVERCSAQDVAPRVNVIASALPQMWDNTGVISDHTNERLLAHRELEDSSNRTTVAEKSSGGEALLRTSIVTLLSALMRKVGPVCIEVEAMRKVVLGVVRFSVDMSMQGGGLYLVEEGCELWAALLAASTEYTDELRRLFPLTEGVLGVDFDNLREVCKLMESYALLGGHQFMSEFGDMLKCVLLRAIGEVKDRGCLAAVDILVTILLRFPKEGVRYMGEILSKIAAKVVAKSESQVVTSAFVGLLSRAALTNVGDFEEVIVEKDERRCVQLMDAMMENVDAMYGVALKKRTAMALCGLMGRYARSAAVRERFAAVVNVVVQVGAQEARGERRRDKEGEEGVDEFAEVLARFGEEARGGGGGDGGEMRGGAAEEMRRAEVQKAGDVSGVQLAALVTHMATEVRKAAGEEAYEAVVRSVDVAVLRQLHGVLPLPR
eukprot:TRINITY_DN408_c0_g1_i1.p1 TRINITY_DN408_c0_g1~~TRINITY_DN408_c0_g1_i1.p1  ORF type:complete len:1024 (-),score=204.35 TRINITY_DN408_c0_g1_i1:13098-16169(-)